MALRCRLLLVLGRLISPATGCRIGVAERRARYFLLWLDPCAHFAYPQALFAIITIPEHLRCGHQEEKPICPITVPHHGSWRDLHATACGLDTSPRVNQWQRHLQPSLVRVGVSPVAQAASWTGFVLWEWPARSQRKGQCTLMWGWAAVSHHIRSKPDGHVGCLGPLVALSPTHVLSLPLPLHSLKNYSLPHEAITGGLASSIKRCFFLFSLHSSIQHPWVPQRSLITHNDTSGLHIIAASLGLGQWQEGKKKR